MNTNHKIRWILFSVLALVLMAFAACGKKEEQGQVESELPDYVYVAEFMDMPEEQDFYNTVFMDGCLYNLQYQWDEETGISCQKLMKFALSNQGVSDGEELFAIDCDNKNVDSFTLDGEGNVYYVMRSYPPLEEGEEPDEQYWEQSTMLLCKCDSLGKVLWQSDITAIMQEDEQNNYIENMAVDNNGMLCISGNSLVRIFDAQGNKIGQVDIGSGWIAMLGRGLDGNIYMAYNDYTSAGGESVLAQIDTAGKKIGTVYKDFPNGNGNVRAFCMTDEKTVLASSESCLKAYDLTTQTSTELLNWLDCDINGNYVEGVFDLGEGELLVLIRDWETEKKELALLTKTSFASVVRKETITIGTLADNQSLQSAIVEFNKQSTQYRVKLKTYLDYSNWSETAYSDAITAMNSDITSDNCPDIINLEGLNVEKLAQKGLFEDLNDYLDQSTVLDRKDYFENILAGMTIAEKLVAIPYSFTLQTIAGRTSDVGEKMGWSLSDVMSLAKAHPGVELFEYANKSQILSYLLMYNKDLFIDYSTGECHFDSQEFQDILAFVATFPDEYDWENNNRPTPYKIADGQLLLTAAYIGQFSDIQVELAKFAGEPVTFIGYPNEKQESGCMMTISESYAITSKSEHKEASWEFLESVLSRDQDAMYSYGFSSRKSVYEEQKEQATRVEYVTDENGEYITDENGDPIPLNSGGSVGYMGDDGEEWIYSFHVTTQEEVDILQQLIDSASLTSYFMDESLNNIIIEEAAPYFKGQKSIEEVVGIIQSRIQLYISENQ